MPKTLLPFQETGRDFLASRRFALLADEPGLGKTVQAAAAAKKLGGHTRVVCPASVRGHWKKELEDAGLHDAIVHSYEGASVATEAVSSLWTLILDESHYLKTPSSKRTQAIFGNKTGWARHAGRVWCLTGTPVLNRPIELYPLLKTLGEGRLRPYDTIEKYGLRYCGAFFDGRAVNRRGATHLAELAAKLDGFMLRRTKMEIWGDAYAPPVVSMIPLQPTTAAKKAYHQAELEMVDRESLLSPSAEHFSAMGDLASLLHATATMKAPSVAAYVVDLVESSLGKVVVFCHHRDFIQSVRELLGKSDVGSVILVGGMTDAAKEIAVRRFVDDPAIRVFIGNIEAAGTGLDGLQTAASDVVFGEISWVPLQMEQAIGRVDRMGKAFPGPVNVHVLHVPDTIESAVLHVHRGKKRVVDILMGSPGSPWEKDAQAVCAI